MSISILDDLLDRFVETYPECPYNYYTDYVQGMFTLNRTTDSGDVVVASSNDGAACNTIISSESKWYPIELKLLTDWLDLVDTHLS